MRWGGSGGEDPNEACLRRLPVSAFDRYIPVVSIENQSECESCASGRCVVDRCVPGRSKSPGEGSRQLWQVAIELRGKSRAGGWAGEVPFAHGKLHAFSYGR